jgi:hypothetical protein
MAKLMYKMSIKCNLTELDFLILITDVKKIFLKEFTVKNYNIKIQ